MKQQRLNHIREMLADADENAPGARIELALQARQVVRELLDHIDAIEAARALEREYLMAARLALRPLADVYDARGLHTRRAFDEVGLSVPCYLLRSCALAHGLLVSSSRPHAAA